MTIFHRHHKIPKHAGGTNNADNIVLLSIEEHAEAHRILYEQHGRWQDYFAWKTLIGQIPVAEAIMQAARMTNIGKPKSIEHRKKLSQAKLGKKLSIEARQKMSRSQTGRKHSDETKKKIGLSNIGKKILPESIEKYRISRSKKDGTPFIFKGTKYATISLAAEVLAIKWHVSKETARGRIRRKLKK